MHCCCWHWCRCNVKVEGSDADNTAALSGVQRENYDYLASHYFIDSYCARPDGSIALIASPLRPAAGAVRRKMMAAGKWEFVFPLFNYVPSSRAIVIGPARVDRRWLRRMRESNLLTSLMIVSCLRLLSVSSWSLTWWRRLLLCDSAVTYGGKGAEGGGLGRCSHSQQLLLLHISLIYSRFYLILSLLERSSFTNLLRKMLHLFITSTHVSNYSSYSTS